jgi:hypothetical protein
MPSAGGHSEHFWRCLAASEPAASIRRASTVVANSIPAGGNTMNRSTIFGAAARALLGVALMTVSASAQAKPVKKQQLIGTWQLVSTENTSPDGGKVDVYGQNPKGILIFDRSGHYSLTIVRSDLPKFAASASNQGTAEENKAVLAGMIASFGTYSVDEASATIMSHVDASSFPNLAGGEQKRVITSLNRNELKYTNPATATGTKAEVVWERAR